MGFLKYKTNGMVSPQGKPRVYFCCHPDDFEYYFDPISDELLQYQKNCAVWYPIDPAFDRSHPEHLADLEQMQLFVMLVTTRLLCTENPALDIEFAFAMEHHIPVLPLMQEQGLEELFNDKCGNLQFLDKSAEDPTAIRYEEKLEKFLSAVLIGDELAEKIRAAFDAYVFLSYRKKDRRYAQELMRLIHQNDFCRDIAIWYDEFLTPGENFNDSIRAALEKSGLFVLTVTPNLVNEENYIVTTEYPLALECGKPILPVESVPTDKTALTNRFEGIPAPTDAHDRSALSEALLAAVKRMAMKEADDSPVHRFFIGMAYLGGVDVEVDHGRALWLISSSANDGLPEACEQLVQMYRTGHGVERNYQTAIQWQHKKIVLLQAAFDADPDEERGHDLLWEIIKCGDFYKELGWLAKAKEQYEAAQHLAEQLQQLYGGNVFERDLSVSYGRLGHIAEAEGNLPAAKAYYEKDLRIAEQLAEETGTVGSRRDLSISYNKLGDIAEAEGNLPAAKAYYEKGLRIAEQLAEKTGTMESRRDLSVSYNKLGDITKAEGDLPAAKAYYEKGLRIAEQLAEETGTVESRRDLSVSYNKLGDIAKAEGDLPVAKAYYEKGLHVREQLADETATVASRRDLSISYERLGDITKAEGDFPAAQAYYEKGLHVREQLADETATVESRRDLSISYNKLGDIAKAEGDLPAAKAYYEKDLRIAEQLAEETGTVASRRDLSVSYNKLGDITKAEGNLPAAQAYYEKSLRIAEQLAEETGTVESRRDLSINYERLGDIAKAEGDLPAAQAYYEKSLHVREQLADETATVASRRDLSISYERLGDIAMAEGDLPVAKAYYEKDLRIVEQLAAETGTVESRRDLSVSYNRIGGIAEAEGDLPAAKTYYEKSLHVREQLAEEVHTAQSYDDLAISHYRLAIVDEQRRREHMLAAERIYAMLCEACPQVERFQKHLEIIRRLLQQ